MCVCERERETETETEREGGREGGRERDRCRTALGFDTFGGVLRGVEELWFRVVSLFGRCGREVLELRRRVLAWLDMVTSSPKSFGDPNMYSR